jgi:uncharacterized damage-inducible protein DinB
MPTRARPRRKGPARPSISLQGVQELVRYDRAVFERFVRRVRRMRGNAATRRRGIGHETLLATLVHVLNVHEVWLTYIIAGKNSRRELYALFDQERRHPTDWAGFDVYARDVWARVQASVDSLTARDLDRRVKAFWMPGRYTVRDAILQTTIEEAHHLGEVIGALWQDDVAPPEMTWMGVTKAPRRSRPRAR